MIERIKNRINRKINKYIANSFEDIKARYEENKWKSIAPQFAKLGNDVRISYPYYISNPQFISLGDNFRAAYDFRLELFTHFTSQVFNPKVVIGNDVSFGTNCHVGAIEKITIGNNVLVASNVYISDHSHGTFSNEELAIPPLLRKLTTKGEIIIGNNVWIGDSVCILPGVCIGENSIIGANSVVTKSVPANVVVAGVPAKIIRLFE